MVRWIKRRPRGSDNSNSPVRVDNEETVPVNSQNSSVGHTSLPPFEPYSTRTSDSPTPSAPTRLRRKSLFRRIRTNAAPKSSSGQSSSPKAVEGNCPSSDESSIVSIVLQRSDAESVSHRRRSACAPSVDSPRRRFHRVGRERRLKTICGDSFSPKCGNRDTRLDAAPFFSSSSPKQKQPKPVFSAEQNLFKNEADREAHDQVFLPQCPNLPSNFASGFSDIGGHPKRDVYRQTVSDAHRYSRWRSSKTPRNKDISFSSECCVSPSIQCPKCCSSFPHTLNGPLQFACHNCRTPVNAGADSSERTSFSNFFSKARIRVAPNRISGSSPVMGAALRKQCCGGRDDQDVKAKAKEQLNDQTFKDDLDLFNEAHEAQDVPGLVNLLESEKPFDNSKMDKIHPWATPPNTIGSLAATSLAFLAAKEDEPIWKDKLREAGGIQKLVTLLKSKEEDRIHAAVVCLSFLSVDNPRNCTAMYEAGAVPSLIEQLRSSIEGMQAASAEALRNVYWQNTTYKQEFVAYGGVPPLLALLDLPSGKFEASALITQLEACFHVQDFILDEGEEVPQFVAAVKDAGVVRKLQALARIDDNQELKEIAQKLLARLSD